ncbi:Bud site selection protein [Wickerhamomyces ciferrii]|uniref:Bud site selection protein n=1 Tax=Wickerhamomyces ciferrii (strain ATCC 14091 / BCRC 22168 / CBS 111 / JCM 3599 / NBRC 0793 / NRRL Y-1031 F-60-10) TaxID=1206466 RepID=K0KR72_WICCF|nr:Bud site selection protein [Wickerhamomyces ciferrii]CCH43793.1 Bud site selection protein [Wickerhamomyces ciferrii]
MASPYKPTTKQTLLPNSNIHELLPETHNLPYDYDDEDDLNIETKNYQQDIYSNQQQQVPHSTLSRLPTLYEVLNRKTQPPVDLWSFYIFMRDYQNSVDYLDFWIDVITHLRLCKDYVKGLRESLLLSEKHKSSSGDDQKRNTTSSSNYEQLQGQGQQGTPGQQQRTSVSSSLLLEALLSEGFLDDNDNKRVSSFLQGNEYINTSDPRINAILGINTIPIEETQGQEPEFEEAPIIQSQSNIQPQTPSTPRSSKSPLLNQYEPLTSPSKTYIRDSPKRNSGQSSINFQQKQTITPKRNSTRILPENLEAYTSNIKNGNITRSTLKSSSKNLLNTYFQSNSSHRLNIPDRIIRKIKHDVELQGRDDPEVFDDAKNYVYNIMERESFPLFLQQNALHNLNNKSVLIRLILGLFLLFAGFWISYVLIFINIRPKSIRAVIIVPFLLGVYLVLTFLYKLDPIMVWLGLSDNQELYHPKIHGSKGSNLKKNWVKNLKEPFIKKLLIKRSIWIVGLTLLISAVLSILFGLVPGHRL